MIFVSVEIGTAKQVWKGYFWELYVILEFLKYNIILIFYFCSKQQKNPFKIVFDF